MKKIIAFLCFFITLNSSFAQDFKKVQTNILLNKFEGAKEEYEKVIVKKSSLANTKEGIYYKARIYGGIAKDSTLKTKYPEAFTQMKSAIEQFIAMDTSFAVAKEIGYDPFFDIYGKAFRQGVSFFTDKKWKDAAAEFDIAVKYSDIVFGQGWTNTKQKFDTTSIIYAGYAHQNAQNLAASLSYYKRLIDANVQSPEYVDIYRFSLLRYIDLKDKSNFDKYLAKSKLAYPNEKWYEFNTEYIEKNLSIAEKIVLFDKLVAASDINEYELQLFGDMFMSGKSMEGITATETDFYIRKAADAYKMAYTKNPKNFAAAFNVGISYYNQFTILDDKYAENIRGLQNLNSNRPAAPKDPKKKLLADAAFKAQLDSVKKLNTELDPSIKAKVEEAIEWIDKAYTSLKDKEKLEKTEKNVMSRAVDFLATLYGYKRDKNRGKDQKAFDEFEIKYNFFDKLHEKYQ